MLKPVWTIVGTVPCKGPQSLLVQSVLLWVSLGGRWKVPNVPLVRGLSGSRSGTSHSQQSSPDWAVPRAAFERGIGGLDHYLLGIAEPCKVFIACSHLEMGASSLVDRPGLQTPGLSSLRELPLGLSQLCQL